MQYLISKEADVNQKNEEGNTLLHRACDSGAIYSVEAANTIDHLIFAAGAALGIKNNRGKTPLELLPASCQNLYKQAVNQYIQELIPMLGLDQSKALFGNTQKQKMAADLWRGLGIKNQVALCYLLKLEYPANFSEDKNQDQWPFFDLQSIKQQVFDYYTTNPLSQSHSLYRGWTLQEVIILPPEIKLKVLEEFLEDKLVEQDYTFLGISEAEKAEQKITPETLLSVLIKSLQATLKPAQLLSLSTQEAPKLR